MVQVPAELQLKKVAVLSEFLACGSEAIKQGPLPTCPSRNQESMSQCASSRVLRRLLLVSFLVWYSDHEDPVTPKPLSFTKPALKLHPVSSGIWGMDVMMRAHCACARKRGGPTMDTALLKGKHTTFRGPFQNFTN